MTARAAAVIDEAKAGRQLSSNRRKMFSLWPQLVLHAWHPELATAQLWLKLAFLVFVVTARKTSSIHA
jgi:hypothetical protein